MTKYKKKPVVVEAIQWDGMNTGEIVEFARDAAHFDFYDTGWKAGAASCVGDLTIHTLEGDHHASVGDYIIRGVKGEFYPCKPDIFEQTYEVCDD